MPTDRKQIIPRDAATLMLVRDGARGMEVFMVLRTLRSEFGAGAYVFPGGAVDAADRAEDLENLCTGLTDRAASRRLGIERGGLAFWVAAIRECFEEAGVLLATSTDGRYVALSDAAHTERYSRHRRALNAGDARFAALCQVEGLRLAAGQVHYYAHWITPEGAPKRYDTRFFVCQAPPEQEPLADGQEIVDHCWIRPGDALAAGRSGEFKIVPVTRKQLESMLAYERAADFVAAAAALDTVPTIRPIVEWGPDGRPLVVRIPLPEGEERVDVRGLI